MKRGKFILLAFITLFTLFGAINIRVANHFSQGRNEISLVVGDVFYFSKCHEADKGCRLNFLDYFFYGPFDSDYLIEYFKTAGFGFAVFLVYWFWILPNRKGREK